MTKNNTESLSRENSQEHSFLGTGWQFPPRFSKYTRSVQMVSDEVDIHQSLTILLSTSVGERFLQPSYGCDLKSYVFEPMDSSYKALLKDLVQSAVLYHEPRIQLLSVTVSTADNEGKVDIELEYLIRSTNTRHNYVFPFYLNEGSEL